MAPLGQERQMFANLNAGRPCRDRLELTTNILGRVGLHVEAVVLRQAAGEKDIDARLGAAARVRAASSGRGLAKTSQVVHPHAQKTDGPGLEHRAAGEAGMS